MPLSTGAVLGGAAYLGLVLTLRLLVEAGVVAPDAAELGVAAVEPECALPDDPQPAMASAAHAAARVARPLFMLSRSFLESPLQRDDRTREAPGSPLRAGCLSLGCGAQPLDWPLP